MRKWHTDTRKFKNCSEHEYFFTETDSKAVCLICKQRVAVLKECNLRRHYETQHSLQFAKYTRDERKVKAGDLLSKLTSQQRTLLQPSTVHENATWASYQISSIIVRSGRPFHCLTALVSDKVRKFGGSVLKYHCILHQEQLCAKSIGLKNVMQDVIAIVNNIRSKALSHRQFQALLDEMEAQYGDLLYHQEVRWLSRGKVLQRFFELHEEIRAFQATKKNNIQVPFDMHWISDLAFLMDITELLNVLNLQLQGKDQIISQL